MPGNPNPSTRFPKGNRIAADNQNQAKKRIRKSRLRKTLTKLHELEPYALENIEKSVKQQEVDKEALNTSRWVITNLMSLTKSAAQDEAEINGLRLEMDKAEAEEGGEPEQTPEEIEKEMPQRLSLVYTAPEEDED